MIIVYKLNVRDNPVIEFVYPLDAIQALYQYLVQAKAD